MSDWNQRARLADELAAMQKTEAWETICANLLAAANTAVMGLGKLGLMQEQQIHFTRGAIWAFTELQQMPERLRTMIVNEISLAEAKARLEQSREQAE